ncbi:MAG: thiamine biosynthesis protein ThiS [Lentisphaerae bacterium RIFOXYB12_FULL_65_16]|nr:MAG: thiamine biosynthesis protein ThiS [Lentisphaerae bacterium RIFOXYA12_64_32]OGV84824.1 MAG: thiamine biosynthesis protein ThiS [Lentisphaerae bacterium RIFOXYB12_FULL_65_16]
MNIEVNGERMEVADNLNVTELLAVRKVTMPDMVSVEMNGSILDRKTFSSTAIKEGDKIEFLYFMGGGALPVLTVAGRGRLAGKARMACAMARPHRPCAGSEGGRLARLTAPPRISLFSGRTAAAVRPEKRGWSGGSTGRWICFTTGARPVESPSRPLCTGRVRSQGARAWN